MPFKGAFDCVRCPGSNDPRAKRACPAWWETTWTNDVGETQHVRSCAFQQLPAYLNNLARQCSEAAASAQAARDEVTRVGNATALILYHRLPDAKSPNELPNATDAERLSAVPHSHHEHSHGVSEDRGGDQQPRLWDDSFETNSAACNGADLFRHNDQ